jgi:serine/threonine protein phosphatase PrpC
VLGDGYVVKRLRAGLMMAVIDGLGHGSEAAAAASLCVDTLTAHAESPVLTMLRHCHERLRGTRGATVSVVCFDFATGAMIWSGVGDVAAVLFRADQAARPREEALVQRAGLLGSGSPTLVASSTPIHSGDLVVLATDGIVPGFERSVDRGRKPQALAEKILAEHTKGTDDALVLVARYSGIQR